MSNISAIILSQSSEKHSVEFLQAKLSALAKERDALAIEKFGSLKAYCDSLVPPVEKVISLDERPTSCQEDEKISFLEKEILAVANEIENLKTSDSKKISSLKAELEKLSRERDELAVKKFTDLQTYANCMGVPSDLIVMKNYQDEISFLNDKIVATENERNALINHQFEEVSSTDPISTRDYEKEISDLQNELFEDRNEKNGLISEKASLELKLLDADKERNQLLADKTKLDKLYAESVKIQASKIVELEEARNELVTVREKHNYASTLELLKIAEIHKCYVHGRYVRDVVVPALRSDFGKCKDTSVHLVMENTSLLTSLLQNAGERLREYKDKKTLSGCSVKKYHWFDSLGDITANVRIYLKKINGGYESESLSNDVYFIPSKNQIVTSNSLSQFYDDCNKNLYRFTESGWDLIYKDLEKASERCLVTKLNYLMLKYTVITHDGRKLYFINNKPTDTCVVKISICSTLFWLEVR